MIKMPKKAKSKESTAEKDAKSDENFENQLQNLLLHIQDIIVQGKKTYSFTTYYD